MDTNTEIDELRQRLAALEARAELHERSLQETHVFISEIVDVFCNASEKNELAVDRLMMQLGKDKHRVLKLIGRLKEKLDPVFHHVFPDVHRFNEEVDDALRRKPPSTAG